MSHRSYELAHCVVCGRRDATELGDAASMRAELISLWEYHAPRLRPETPPHRLADRVTFSEPAPWRLVRCDECGLVYRNPIERALELTEAYARSVPPRDVLAALHAAQLPTARAQVRRLRELTGGRGAGLEVGSYVGAFLVAAAEAGLQFDGLDVNSAVNCFARELGACVHDGELQDHPDSRPLGVLAIWNTFDQLADPRGCLFEAWRRIRPGGVLALRVPNGGFYARQHPRLARGNRAARAAALTMLAQNNLLAFPYRWGFTVDALRRLLEETGFAVARVHGDVLVSTSDEWTRGWARWEERAIKAAMAGIARVRPAWAPWLEIFAIRDSKPVQTV